MIYTGEAIKKLIPQRDPIVMVDALQEPEGDACSTTLLVRENNYFVEPNRMMAEPGLIEHIAQSANALMSYRQVEQGQEMPVYFITEVKKFHCYRSSRVGELLQTTIKLDVVTPDALSLAAEVRVGDELIADTQLKMNK